MPLTLSVIMVIGSSYVTLSKISVDTCEEVKFLAYKNMTV